MKRIAIVGGGTIGLYVAALLSETHEVSVFEADISPDRQAGDLLGESRDLGAHDGSVTGWASGLGGTSRLWGGQLLPWQDWEFEAQDGSLKWPVSGQDLESSYRRVLLNLGLPKTHEQVHDRQLSWSGELGPISVRHSTWMKRRQRDFSLNRSLRRRWRRASFVRGAIVDSVVSRAEGVQILYRSEGRGHSRIFDQVILAAGTLGNVRILSQSLTGVARSQVGRGFIDHVSARVATFSVNDWKRFRTVAAPSLVRGVRASVKYVAQPPLLERLDSQPGYGHWEFDYSSSAVANALLRSGSLRGGGSILKEGVDVLSALYVGARTSRYPVPRFVTPHLRVDVEQLPAPDQRLTWIGGADGHMKIDWHVSADDRESIARLGRAILAVLSRQNIGATPIALDDEEVIDTKHLMGGTPMDLEGSRGVVDADCRVHGLPGVWVGGASVFPTGGVANPTFTALALAERMVTRIG